MQSIITCRGRETVERIYCMSHYYKLHMQESGESCICLLGAFLILFQELNVAMVIKEFNILMLKSPINQERYKILLMIYFLIY
jgi:hypothetical protein